MGSSAAHTALPSVSVGYYNSYKTTSSTAEVTPTTIITIDTETPIDQKDLVQQ
jgi:hypothetical protein